MKNGTPPLVVLMGPTASGKSALALALAEEVRGEIVSADSMQLYRDLAIGTAQPTLEERTRVAHHLVGCCELHERVDVFDYCARADAAIAEIRTRGKRPIVAGGTGLYLRSLLYGLDALPTDQQLRKELDRTYDSPEGETALHEKMRSLDPAALGRFSACRRRLLRALEVKLLTGRSILELQQEGPRPLRCEVKAWKLEYAPETLAERIAQRTDAMLKNGWIDEAERALKKGILQTPTAHQAIGYRQIGEFLAGKCSRDAMREAIVIATRQLARRQRTWFRHQHPEAAALAMEEVKDPLAALLRQLSRP